MDGTWMTTNIADDWGLDWIGRKGREGMTALFSINLNMALPLFSFCFNTKYIWLGREANWCTINWCCLAHEWSGVEWGWGWRGSINWALIIHHFNQPADPILIRWWLNFSVRMFRSLNWTVKTIINEWKTMSKKSNADVLKFERAFTRKRSHFNHYSISMKKKPSYLTPPIVDMKWWIVGQCG